MSDNIHSTAIVDDGANIAPTAKIWHFCHVRNGAIIENNVSLARDVYIDKNVKVSKGSRIQNGVSIYDGVTIGEWCFVGPHVIFTNDLYPRAGNLNWNITPTTLESGCSIGAGAIIRCGISVGTFALVAAGAIVTKDIPPFTLVVGTPAREVAKVCACGQTRLPLETEFAELVRTCCSLNLQDEVLHIAEAQVTKMKSQSYQESLL